MNKNGEQEKERRLEKRVFVCVIAFAAFLAAVLSIVFFLPEREKNSGIISSALAEEASASPEREAGTSHLPEIAASPAAESTVSSLPEEKEERMPSSSVKILGLPEEVLTLMHCTEGQLAGEMKEYFNANGFADVAEVAYENETVISHGDNSVSACFSLEREGEAYEVCCIYSRDSGNRSMDVWE